MSSSECHDYEVSGPEFRPRLHVVSEDSQPATQAALPVESFYPEDTQPSTASTIPLGSLALAPHDEADKEVYEQPLTLTDENFPGFYSHWYSSVTRMTLRRMSKRERGLGANEDAAQRVFEGLLTDFVGTDKNIGLHEKGSPRGFLEVLARNKAVDYFRSEVRHDKAVRAAISDLQTETASAEDIALENMEREATAKMVHSYLQKLTQDEQELLLQSSSNVPLADIAEQLGIAYGTLRVRLHRARHKLKGLIEGTLDEATLPKPRQPREDPTDTIPQPRRQSKSVTAEPALSAEPVPVEAIDLDALVSNLQPAPAPKKSNARATTNRPPAAPRTRKPKPPAKEPVSPEDNEVIVPRHVHLPHPDPTYIRESSVGHHEALFAAAGLKAEDIDILTWSDVDGSSVADLGSLLGQSKGAVDARLQRLRRRVREYTEGGRTA